MAGKGVKVRVNPAAGVLRGAGRGMSSALFPFLNGADGSGFWRLAKCEPVFPQRVAWLRDWGFLRWPVRALQKIDPSLVAFWRQHSHGSRLRGRISLRPHARSGNHPSFQTRLRCSGLSVPAVFARACLGGYLRTFLEFSTCPPESMPLPCGSDRIRAV